MMTREEVIRYEQELAKRRGKATPSQKNQAAQCEASSPQDERVVHANLGADDVLQASMEAPFASRCAHGVATHKEDAIGCGNGGPADTDSEHVVAEANNHTPDAAGEEVLKSEEGTTHRRDIVTLIKRRVLQEGVPEQSNGQKKGLHDDKPHPKPDGDEEMPVADEKEDEGDIPEPDKDDCDMHVSDEDERNMPVPDEDEGDMPVPEEDEGDMPVPDENEGDMPVPDQSPSSELHTDDNGHGNLHTERERAVLMRRMALKKSCE